MIALLVTAGEFLNQIGSFETRENCLRDDKKCNARKR